MFVSFFNAATLNKSFCDLYCHRFNWLIEDGWKTLLCLEALMAQALKVFRDWHQSWPHRHAEETPMATTVASI